MADVISPTDRALIAEALAAGRVTRVPRGVSGLPGYVCDPETGRLVSEAGSSWKEVAKARGMRRTARIRRLQAVAPVTVDAPSDQAPEGASKAARMRALLLAGESPRVVAVKVGVGTSYVYQIQKEMREKAALPPAAQRPDFPALRREALALFESGLGYSAVAERLGTSRHAVAGLVRRGRIERERARDAT